MNPFSTTNLQKLANSNSWHYSEEEVVEVLDRVDALAARMYDFKTMLESEEDEARKQGLLDDFNFTLDKIEESLKWFGG